MHNNLECYDTLQWIADNPWHVIMFTVVTIALIVLIYLNRRDVLLKSALYIVAKVEDEWGSDMGKIKFAEAYTYLKSKYPFITFFLPEAKLSEIIEDALDRLKKILASKAAKEEKEKLKAENEEAEANA